MKSSTIDIIISLILLLSCKGYDDQVGTAGPGETSSHHLPDGREISYMEFGSADGTPLLYFHGCPGSHEDIHLFKGATLAETAEAIRYLEGGHAGRRL